jgi:hypothetical protein
LGPKDTMELGYSKYFQEHVVFERSATNESPRFIWLQKVKPQIDQSEQRHIQRHIWMREASDPDTLQ